MKPQNQLDVHYNPKMFYLIGALRDGCLTTQNTIKFKQKNREWLSEILVPLFLEIFNRKIKNNIYDEKRKNDLWCLAFKDKDVWNVLYNTMKTSPKTSEEEKFYIMGFWDADGGCPKEPSNEKKIYIKFTQKDKESLNQLKEMIERLEIKCGNVRISELGRNGKIWRFSITNLNGILNFSEKINSLHPEKRQRLEKIKYLLSTR